MKKFMIFGAMAVVSFAGCKENEPEEPVVSGWVEVDPSLVSESDYTPASASDAVGPVAGLPGLQSESTATVEEAAPRKFEDVNMELKTWHTTSNGIKMVRVPTAYKVPAGTTDTKDFKEGTALVSLSISNGFLVFESEITMDLADSDNLKLVLEFPDGGKFQGLAIAKGGKFYMIKDVMDTVGLMKYYEAPIGFSFRTENGDWYMFDVPSGGL